MLQNWAIQEFKEQISYRLDESSRMLELCLRHLSEEDMWYRPNASSNTIANLMLHLCGNIRQYAISSLGEQADTRQRDEEFSTTGGFTKSELWNKLQMTIAEAKTVMEAASDEQMLRKRMVQGFELSGIGILLHITEHYSYHTGQIALTTKLLKNGDLGFYADLDLNTKNEG